MSAPLYIKVKDEDNVAIAVEDIAAGTQVMPGVITRQDIPQAHKIALTDIPKGGEIIRYGVVLGYAKDPIPVGAWINEHMLDLPQSPGLDDMPYGTNIVPPEKLPDPPRTTWLGYRNEHGPAGTRNLLGIVTTVQCAAGVLKVAVERIKRELLPKYPNVDGVVAVTHPYGCGVAFNAPLAYIPIRAITNVIRHPNFGGEIMVVGLGCEKLTYDRVLSPEDITPENVLTLQDYAGHDAMMQAMHEVVTLAGQEGVPLPADAPETWLREMMPAFAADAMPSMRQDVLARRPTEVEQFAGVICRLGKKHGVPTPVNDFFYARIREIEAGWTQQDTAP